MDANAEVMRRLAESDPVLVGIKFAAEFVPSLKEMEFLHAGPPLEGWHEACGALRGAVSAALMRAGQARNIEEAEKVASGVTFRSANDSNVLGTYAGVIGSKTPLFVVENRSAGTFAGAALNEGRGKAARYGSTDAATLSRLTWLETELAPMLDQAIKLNGGIKVFDILEQALHMGDEAHSRHKAASALFTNAIAAPLLDAGYGTKETSQALKFLCGNDIFFLPLTMSAAKATLLAAHDVNGSTIVTSIAANGVRLGIKLAGNTRWSTAPVPIVRGKYFEGFNADDAGPVIGDSEVAETIGLGAFALAGAPALSAYMGGTPESSTRMALEMYQIAVTEHHRFKVPALGYRGTPFGIDARRVIQTGIEPIYNTGIAHRSPGIGQIGAGYCRVPLECFRAALEDMPGQ